MFFDLNKLIVQRDLDGGDTAGREGDFWFALGLNPNWVSNRDLTFDDVLTLLQISPGVYVRNPVHYNDPKDFSRDQTIPLILAMGQLEKYENLKQLFWKQVKNFGRYANGDIGGPEDLGYYIRANKEWYLYPVLILGDTQMLVNTLIRIVKSKKLTDTSDDINHTLALIQAQYELATPISWLARKLYKSFVVGGIQSRWDSYFNPASGANDFNELYRNLILEM